MAKNWAEEHRSYLKYCYTIRGSCPLQNAVTNLDGLLRSLWFSLVESAQQQRFQWNLDTPPHTAPRFHDIAGELRLWANRSSKTAEQLITWANQFDGNLG